MQLYFRLVNRTLIVSILGEIDHHTSDDTKEKIDNRIDSSSALNIIFDFTDVKFMDSAGIGIIIGRYKKISPLGGKTAIANASQQVKRILEVSGIPKIYGLYDSLNEALSHM